MLLPWFEAFPSDLVSCIRTLPHGDLLRELSARAASLGLKTGQGRALQFVPHDALPLGVSYELFIAETGQVPTRDNLHDRFNALIWLVAPKTKAALNGQQSQAIARQSSTQVRGALRDAATIWDENLLVICAPPEEGKALNVFLTAHDWHSLFISGRSNWHRKWHAKPFGHALLEKLDSPFKSITAHTLVVSSDPQWPRLDEALALAAAGPLSTKLFHPLPVMGIPGWHAQNQDSKFYADAKVFRPARFA